MFYIKTKVKASKINGLGLFTGQDISKGELVYRHNPNLDLILTQNEFDLLEQAEQALINHYGYREKVTGNYRLDHDDIRFVNDSNTPNIGLDISSGDLIALIDIHQGDEVTQNYSDFENRRFV